VAASKTPSRPAARRGSLQRRRRGGLQHGATDPWRRSSSTADGSKVILLRLFPCTRPPGERERGGGGPPLPPPVLRFGDGRQASSSTPGALATISTATGQRDDDNPHRDLLCLHCSRVEEVGDASASLPSFTFGSELPCQRVVVGGRPRREVMQVVPYRAEFGIVVAKWKHGVRPAGRRCGRKKRKNDLRVALPAQSRPRCGQSKPKNGLFTVYLGSKTTSNRRPKPATHFGSEPSCAAKMHPPFVLVRLHPDAGPTRRGGEAPVKRGKEPPTW
jgi:hypothetical protein